MKVGEKVTYDVMELSLNGVVKANVDAFDNFIEDSKKDLSITQEELSKLNMSLIKE